MMKKEVAEYGSPDASRLLGAHGLGSLSAVSARGETFHERYDAKSVAHVDLNHNGETLRIYIKKQWKHSRLIPRIHSFRCGKAFQSYPLQEWRGLHLLRSLGLDTAEPLALFRHRWHPYKAAVITLALPVSMNLTQMLTEGAFDALAEADRAVLCETFVAIIKTLHGSGLGWRSMDIKHFFPDRQEDGSWKIWLIDCEGVYRPVSSRYIDRERRSVLAAVRRNGRDWKSTDYFAEQIEQHLLQHQAV